MKSALTILTLTSLVVFAIFEVNNYLADQNREIGCLQALDKIYKLTGESYILRVNCR